MAVRLVADTDPTHSPRLPAFTGESVEVVTDPAALGELSAEWRVLAEQRGNVFVTPEWFFAWLRHYGETARPFVPVVRREDGSLAGLLPTVVSTTRRTRTLSFAGANLGDFFHPVAAVEDEAAVAAAAARALGERRSDWSVAVWHNVEASAPWLSAFAGSSPARLAAIRDQENVLPYIGLAGMTWDAFLASLSHNLRGQLGRKLRRLEREHAVVFRRTTNAGELESDMTTFFERHDRRWAARGGSSVASDRARAFHRDFAKAALEAGWLRLWFLDVDGEPVASWYGWRIGDRYVYYLAGFEPAWSTHSVGLLLLAQTIREAVEEEAAEYDMLLGDEEYKSRFTSLHRTVRTVVLTPSLHPVRLLASLDVSLRNAGRMLPPGARERVRGAAERVLRLLPSARER